MNSGSESVLGEHGKKWHIFILLGVYPEPQYICVTYANHYNKRVLTWGIRIRKKNTVLKCSLYVAVSSWETQQMVSHSDKYAKQDKWHILSIRLGSHRRLSARCVCSASLAYTLVLVLVKANPHILMGGWLRC